MAELSHVDERGGVRMVDVGGKPMSRRRATARATVSMAAATAAKLRALPKGDALVTAQLAGIMAAKRTSELIPLCHPLPLSNVDVTCRAERDRVEIQAVVETTAQTGVEMEALTAASVAALTVYDMAKAIDKKMVIGEVELVEKTKEAATGRRRCLPCPTASQPARATMRAAGCSWSCSNRTGSRWRIGSSPMSSRRLRLQCASSRRAPGSC
jgi:cyclic pyranopterin phosphate synthase